MKKALLSIIVPVFNTEKYLHICINSLINQSYKELEIILINDGSTDGSYEICKKFSSFDQRIKVYHKLNGGVSSARNLGLREAKGDFITFVDSDDVISRQACEKMMQQGDYDIIKCAYKRCYHDIKKSVLNKYECSFSYDHDNTRVIEMFIKEKFFNSVCLSIFKKSVINKLFFNEAYSFGEDYYFYFEALWKATSICVINECLYFYNCNEDSATQKFTLNKTMQALDNHYTIDHLVYQKMIDNGYSAYVKDCAKCSYDVTLIWLRKAALHLSFKQYKAFIKILMCKSFFQNNKLLCTFYKEHMHHLLVEKVYRYYVKFRYKALCRTRLKNLITRLGILINYAKRRGAPF